MLEQATKSTAERPGPGLEPKPGTVERLRALRDGIIALGGFVYLAGYLSWTLYALEHDLGLIPALDAQFFSAGLVPTLIVIAFWYSVRLLFYVKRWLGRELTERERKIGRLLSAAGTALVLAGFAVDWLSDGRYGQLKTPLIMAGMVSFYGAVCFSRGKFERRLMQPMALVLAWGYLILGGWWLLYGYYYKWFPMLPQELGGPAAKCVEFDLAAVRLSETTRRMVGSTPDATGVHRSIPLNLIFRGSAFVILEKPAVPGAEPLNFRLGSGAIEAIFPCDRGNTGT